MCWVSLSLPLFPGPFCPRVVLPVRVSSRNQRDLLKNLLLYVIYWPSTEPSIKRCTCVNKRKNSGSRWTLNNNITRAQMAWVSWGQDAELRASGRQRALGPQRPTVEQPSQDEEEVLLWSKELGVNIAVYPCFQLISHTQPTSPFQE